MYCKIKTLTFLYIVLGKHVLTLPLGSGVVCTVVSVSSRVELQVHILSSVVPFPALSTIACSLCQTCKCGRHSQCKRQWLTLKVLGFVRDNYFMQTK